MNNINTIIFDFEGVLVDWNSRRNLHDLYTIECPDIRQNGEMAVLNVKSLFSLWSVSLSLFRQFKPFGLNQESTI